jgi:hypothetical protein
LPNGRISAARRTSDWSDRVEKQGADDRKILAEGFLRRAKIGANVSFRPFWKNRANKPGAV